MKGLDHGSKSAWCSLCAYVKGVKSKENLQNVLCERSLQTFFSKESKSHKKSRI
jgi:hypothetical protein